MNKYLLIIVITLLLGNKSFSQVFSGTTAGQFLKIEVGAKAIAMGGAFVSQANDASALYWNPGGLSKLQNSGAVFTHTYWLADINHDFAGIVLKIGDQHTIGFSYTSLTMGDMKVRTEIYPEGTGELFTASDYSLGVSYGLNLTEDFSIGFTGKYVGENIWHMSASTIAFDFGLLYYTPVKNLQLGMSVSNIGGKMKFTGEDNFIYYTYNPDEHGNSDKIYAELKMDEWDLPLIYRVGLSFKTLDTEIHALTISADAIHPNDYDESVNIGCEYGFRERVFLRAGYKSLFMTESVEGLTAGIGLIYFLTDYIPVKVDYAYADFGSLQSVHRISVEIGF
ncbi:MAG: PorV/PorQ family protein [Ignavibacteriaceae bacterium]|nr:PorV/PorQ family protein [Ignavibacteriaceae bacterium]